MSDFFDTSVEGQEVELEDGFINEGDDINLTVKDPTLHTILIGAGWDLNAFNADALDLDLSLFLLDKDKQTRVDEDFVFYNQPETLDNAVKHNGDSRTGAGDGDDESVTLDFRGLPFDIMHVGIFISIYKGYEKEQNLGMVRNGYVRIVNAENSFELCRLEIDDLLADKEETGVMVGYLNREGPKWHYKADVEFVPGGLSEIAKRFGLIIKSE